MGDTILVVDDQPGPRRALATELEDAGFTKVRSAVVPGFRFKKGATQNSAEAYGVKSVMMTALKD